MCKVRSEDRISAEKLRSRLKLKNMRECLHERRMQWFGQLKGVIESAWSSKCRTFKVSSSFPRGQPRKTWNEVIRCGIAKGKFLEVFHKKPSNSWKHGSRS